MTRGAFLALPLLWTLSVPAAANDPGQEAYMIRMLFCQGNDANMEVYIPQSIALAVRSKRRNKGYELQGADTGVSTSRPPKRSITVPML
jgi:hypothetical protein